MKSIQETRKRKAIKKDKQRVFINIAYAMQYLEF